MILKDALRKQPVKKSEPEYQAFISLFTEMNGLLHLVDRNIVNVSDDIAVSVFIPLIEDVEEMLSIAGVYIKGLESNSGKKLLSNNRDQLNDVIVFMKDAVSNIQSQLSSTLQRFE